MSSDTRPEIINRILFTNCYVNFRRVKSDISQHVGIASDVAPYVTKSEWLSCLSCICRRKKWVFRKKSLKHYCTIHYQKVTGYCMEIKQIVNGVINAKKFIRPLGLKCEQFKALLNGIWLLRVTPMIFKFAGLLAVRPCKFIYHYFLFCGARN